MTDVFLLLYLIGFFIMQIIMITAVVNADPLSNKAPSILLVILFWPVFLPLIIKALLNYRQRKRRP